MEYPTFSELELFSIIQQLTQKPRPWLLQPQSWSLPHSWQAPHPPFSFLLLILPFASQLIQSFVQTVNCLHCPPSANLPDQECPQGPCLGQASLPA